MNRPRIFGSHLTPGQKRVYGAVVAFYVVAFFATIWPLYSFLGGARPLILGLPLSLFWLVCVVLASFVVQLLLLRWEKRRGALDPPAEDQCPPG